MSDHAQPAAAPAPTAPAVDAAPAPEAAAAPPGPAPKRHPYAAKPVVRPVAAASPAAPVVDAKPTAPKGSRVLAMRERELAALRGEVEPLKAARTEYETLLAPIVERELATLPEQARAAIAKKHGKDAAAVLREITYLRSLGAFAPVAAPPAAPATTAPKAAAPGVAVEVDDDLAHLRAHEKLVAGGQPLRAATYLAQHAASISRGRQKAARAS